LAADREFRPIIPKSSPRRRDIVSETGFRLFGQQVTGASQSPEAAFHEAETFIGGPVTPLTDIESAECIVIADRLSAYVRGMKPRRVTFLPKHPGHGMMAPCIGDIAVDDRIIEIKYVDRSFRSTDLRQLLCYCALRYFSVEPNYEYLSLFNPLRGTAIAISVSELIASASGRSAEEFYQDFSYALSSGEISR
ncbi:hypothetical protein, partial [Devosia sp.]|uniref:hypothetical protein n=1 Tax=Devosia sp. TaxID=1871048 RepID=UPI001ACD8340